MPKASKAENGLVPLMVRLPPELHAAIKRMASKSRRSLNSQCIILLEDAVKQTGVTLPAAESEQS
jgi:hypothetical protein